MLAKAEPMKCPECGVEMNYHAEKLIDPRSPEEAAKVDPALGGILEEMHTCPECGMAHSRLSV